jgi:hypothetical protein
MPWGFLVLLVLLLNNCKTNSDKTKFDKLIEEATNKKIEMKNLTEERTEYYNKMMASIDQKYRSEVSTILLQNAPDIDLNYSEESTIDQVFTIGGSILGFFKDQSKMDKAKKLLTDHLEVLKDYQAQYIMLEMELNMAEGDAFVLLIENEDLLSKKEREEFMNYMYKKNLNDKDISETSNRRKSQSYEQKDKTISCNACDGQGKNYDGQYQQEFLCNKCGGKGWIYLSQY